MGKLSENGELQMMSLATPSKGVMRPELQSIWAPTSKVMTWVKSTLLSRVLHSSLIQKAPCAHLTWHL